MAKNILVVDDSALMRRVICDIINSDSNYMATDVCRDGLDAYEIIKKSAYDGVVLDVNMPRMDGLQLLEQLQKDRIKANIFIVSTLTTKDAEVTLKALELGAIDFVTKPTNIIEAKGEDFKSRLLSVFDAFFKTHAALGVRTNAVGNMRTAKPSGTLAASTDAAESASGVSATGTPAVPSGKKRLVAKGARNRLVALACSTGGPKALQDVIPYLSKNLDAPMVLVQHMPVGFTKSMADRLDEISPIRVTEAANGDRLEKGHVYVAPGGKHMEVRKSPDGGHRIVLSDAPAIGGLKPCANITFESISDTDFDEIICVVLTGMGADGTKGILSLMQHKPVHVIAQNAETCVVYGMPKMIAEAGVVDEVVPLKEVANTINKSVGVK